MILQKQFRTWHAKFQKEDFFTHDIKFTLREFFLVTFFVKSRPTFFRIFGLFDKIMVVNSVTISGNTFFARKDSVMTLLVLHFLPL